VDELKSDAAITLTNKTYRIIWSRHAILRIGGQGTAKWSRFGACVRIRYPGNPYPRSQSRRARAFTLTELLVVIGVIILLVALLLPVLSKARSASQSVACLSNLRQIMMAFRLYGNDNRQELPDPQALGQSWESILRPYLTPREVYHCEADGGLFEHLRSSYDWRDTAPNLPSTVSGKSFNEIRNSGIVFVFDALPDWHSQNTINAAKVDGSAENMSYLDCLKNLDLSIRDPGP
jgi:type II secretory pathway pseudopilin PulG